MKIFKRLLLPLLLVFAAVGAALALSACGDKGHEHSYGEWIERVAATCTSEGEEVSVCEECGEEISRVIPKKPHTEVTVAGKQPTCTEEGLTDGKKCSVCQTFTVAQQPIPAAGHSWGEPVAEQEATCTAEGYGTHDCGVCGAHENCVIPKKPHTEVTVAGRQPTCTEEGLTEGKKCSVCQTFTVQQQSIPAKGHDYTGVNWVKKTDITHGADGVPAQNGTHSRLCKVCGNEDVQLCSYTTRTYAETCEEGGYHIHHCTQCSNNIRHEDLPAKGHDMPEEWTFDGGYYTAEWKIVYRHKKVCRNGCGETQYEDCTPVAGDTVEATCTMAGYTQYSCSDCGHEYTDDAVSAKGHDFSGTPTPYGTAGTWRHRYTCLTCGVAYRDERCSLLTETIQQQDCEHDMKNQTRCTLCDYRAPAYIVGGKQKLGHDLSAWEYIGGDQHKQYCRRPECSYLVTEDCELDSTEKLPTCTAAGSISYACKKCLNTSEEDGGEALGHSYLDTWVTLTAGENGVGATHHKICQNCGAEDKQPCSFTCTFSSEPNCTLSGVEQYECNECNNSYEVIIPALGHDWKKVYEGDREVIEYTVTEENHKRVCTRAGCELEETAPHSFALSNLCECGKDGLKYVDMGADCAVFTGRHLTQAKQIIIPEYHDGKKVIAINAGRPEGTGNLTAFYGMQNITSVTIPASVVTIGKSAFDSCFNLSEVTLSGDSGLTTIEESAFSYCYALERVNLPSSIKVIGEKAFYNCRALVDINIPFSEQPSADNIIDIGGQAFFNTGFYNDSSHWTDNALYISNHLIKVNPARFSQDGESAFTVKPGTVTIGANAFEGCEYLVTLELPSTLKEVGVDAFLNCVSLHEVTFDGKFADWLSMQFENDYASPMAYANVLHIQGAEGHVVIPENVTSIPAGTFKGSAITGVTIPESVISIGEEAFENCKNLNTITLTGVCKIAYVGKDILKGTPYFDNPENWEKGLLYLGTCFIAANTRTWEQLNLPAEHELNQPGNEQRLAAAKENFIIPETVVMKEGTLTVAVEAFKGNTTARSVTIAASAVYIGEDAFTGSGVQEVKFADANNWFAWSKNLGIGRAPTLSSGNCRSAFDTYSGYWRKMK